MDDKDHAIILEKIDRIIEANVTQNEQLNKIEVLITGNGNPENGMIVKAIRLSEKVESMYSVIKIHWWLFATMISLLIGITLKTVIGV